MFFYFGYGSNMSLISFRAKGVEPIESEPAVLPEWRLAFNVRDFFRIEGGTGNIEPASGDVVHGVLHTCRDEDLAALDQLEALGVSYERRQAEVTTYSGRRVTAFVYVGLPSKLMIGGLPSERYRNILVRGAQHMGLEPAYVARLRSLPICDKPQYPTFEFPAEPDDVFSLERLGQNPTLVGLAGAVFDMSDARPEHDYLRKLFGGTDATLLFLKRMDSSSGGEVFDHVVRGSLSNRQRDYLNDYLHEFSREYRYVGRLSYRLEEGLEAGARTTTFVPWQVGDNLELPARRVLREAQETNRLLGHENLGFLSESHGFMPRVPPRLSLTSQLHAPWDAVVAEMTDLYRGLGLRRRIDALPVLPADEHHLPDEDLLRASAILAMLAHAYWYVENRPPTVLPDALRRPWADVRRRLVRGPEVLSYVDLVVYNWRLLDPTVPDPIRVDNLRLLIPTVDTNEERIFYLTQTEILARSGPIIPAVVQAQEAALADDRESLEEALLTVIGSLRRIVDESLLRINPSPASESFMDPVVWAKTVAPFAVPMESGIQGPSGTSSPIFNLLDTFFGRNKHQTFLGREIRQLRQVYPPHWQTFLEAVGQVSVCDHVRRIGSRSLSGLLQEAIEMYAGENGFLGRHRMKVYGYLELAFKVGRSVTIGGFSGIFDDRTWDQVDSELEYARLERLETFPKVSHRAYVKDVRPAGDGVNDHVAHVVLDISHTGIRYEAGDRCGILVENDPSLVDRTLRALRATGEERIALSPEWREAVRLRDGYENASDVSLRDILTFGRIRPVVLRLAEALHAASQNATLKTAIETQTTTRWELWDLLELLAQDGFDPTRLWRAPLESSEHVCRVLPPETFRMYSISSTMRPGEQAASELHLTVGVIRYDSGTSRDIPAAERRGAASNFLSHAAGRKRPITFIIRHPPRFSLPEDPRVPVVMLAGGTGIGPFRAFVAERDKHPDAGPALLFWSLRSRENFYYGDEFRASIEAGKLALNVGFSRDDVRIEYRRSQDGEGRFVFEEAPRAHVQDLLLVRETAEQIWSLIRSREEGGQGAYLYICGRSQFARSVDRALREIVERSIGGPEANKVERARAVIERLIAQGRYNHEIFTDARSWEIEREEYDVSEIVLHNDAGAGWWMVIDNVVYDLTDFIRQHPGGARVLQGYAGMDATQGYLRSHAGRSEVDAMRELYELGTVRRPDFRGVVGTLRTRTGTQTVALSALHQSWIGLLYLVVEMQNALRHDQSLQRAVVTRGTTEDDPSLYKLQRSVETHERFLQSYLGGIAGQIGRLWEITAGLCKPDEDLHLMGERVEGLLSDPRARRIHALTETLYGEVHFVSVEDPSGQTSRYARLDDTCRVLQAEDTRFISEVKSVLREGVLVFEELEDRTLDQGAHRLTDCVRELASVVETYLQRISDAVDASGWVLSGDDAGASASQSSTMRRELIPLVSTDYWVMEEDPERRIVFLRRSPVAADDLQELVRQNELVISQLRPEYATWGIVADMRQTAGRNDVEFESAMRRLRQTLGESFARVAVLLASASGVLQVNRLGRNDDSQKLFATQSEQAAARFAMGDAAVTA